jgi:hypothetical protein
MEAIMVDAFDCGFDSPATPAPAAAPEYAVLAEGTHELEVVAATVGAVAWKTSEANPTGECLKLRLSAGRGYAFVFADLPRDRKFLFRALAASLGIQPGPDGKVSMCPPEQMIGKRVHVEIGRYTTRAGEARATVKRWLPAAVPTPSEAKPVAAGRSSRPARTKPAAAAFQANAALDEFPF